MRAERCRDHYHSICRVSALLHTVHWCMHAWGERQLGASWKRQRGPTANMEHGCMARKSLHGRRQHVMIGWGFRDRSRCFCVRSRAAGCLVFETDVIVGRRETRRSVKRSSSQLMQRMCFVPLQESMKKFPGKSLQLSIGQLISVAGLTGVWCAYSAGGHIPDFRWGASALRFVFFCHTL